MTTEVYEAVFQDGAFRPVHPVSKAIAEGQHVRLIVELEQRQVVELEQRQDVLKLAAGVYEGLSDDEINEIERIALDRRNFFGERARIG